MAERLTLDKIKVATVIQGVVFVACVLAFRRGIVGELAAMAKVAL